MREVKTTLMKKQRGTITQKKMRTCVCDNAHLPFAILSSILNDRIFKEAILSFDDLFSSVLWRVAKWVLSKRNFANRWLDGILYNWEATFCCGPSRIRKMVLQG